MVHDCVKEVDEGETFGAFFLANFCDSKYCLKEVYLSDNSSGTNAIQAEPGHPVRVALTFGSQSGKTEELNSNLNVNLIM